MGAAPAGGSHRRARRQLHWERPELLELFPFPHRLDYVARIEGTALRIETSLTATSQLAVPVSFGFHPSFICFEPMSAPTNALCSGDALPMVRAGGSFRALFRVTVHAA